MLIIIYELVNFKKRRFLFLSNSSYAALVGTYLILSVLYIVKLWFSETFPINEIELGLKYFVISFNTFCSIILFIDYMIFLKNRKKLNYK